MIIHRCSKKVNQEAKRDMQTLINADKIKDYGEYSFFPVFSGK